MKKRVSWKRGSDEGQGPGQPGQGSGSSGGRDLAEGEDPLEERFTWKVCGFLLTSKAGQNDVGCTLQQAV
jgi:hypothetical protein